MAGQVQQVGLGFASPAAVALDGIEQLVDAVDQQAQFVFFLAGQHGHHHLAWLFRVDEADMLDDPSQRTGQQYVVQQIHRPGHDHRPQQTGEQDDHGIAQKAPAVGSSIQRQLQVAVIVVIRRAAIQRNIEALLGTEQGVGQVSGVNGEAGALAAGQRFFLGMTNDRTLDCGVGKQTFNDLSGHIPVEAEDGLAGGIVEHGQNFAGVPDNGFTDSAQVDQNLRQTQQHPYQQCPQQHQPQQLD